MTELCEELKIIHHNSSTYRPKKNGVVKASNKNIKKIIQKMVVTYKDWHEMLPFALHGYRTSVRTSTGETPFSLVYGMEAVLPVEVEIPSLQVIMETKLSPASSSTFRLCKRVRLVQMLDPVYELYYKNSQYQTCREFQDDSNHIKN